MTRLKSTLATILLTAAAVAALGLGFVLAMASLVIGLVVALAARLAVGAARSNHVPVQDAEAGASVTTA